jgi:amino-acid N-acetyltransferase
LVTIRKAEWRDVPVLHRLINHYAAEHVMLPRTLADLRENIGQFTVAEQDGILLGAGALKLYGAELAEIRSLWVEVALRTNGTGRTIVQALLEEAGRLGVKTVFALTVAPDFFGKLGFHAAPREQFPAKVWQDCFQCAFYSNCVEQAVCFELAPRHACEVEPPAEAAQVSL